MIITITIPPAAVSTLVPAFCAQTGWNAGLGIQESDYMVQQILTFIKNTSANGIARPGITTQQTNAINQVTGFGLLAVSDTPVP